MPKLITKASINISQNGAPLENANVSLKSVDGSITWTVGGTTDHNGVAKLVTHGQFPGAPTGKYKVIVNKYERPESKYQNPTPGQSEDDFKALKESEDLTAYELVDPKYGKADTSDAIVEITDASPTASVDVGDPVRIKLEESP